MSHRSISPSLVLLSWLALATSAQALTIVDRFVPAGGDLTGIGVAGEPPQAVVGAGTLQNVFRAAADHWERVIRDDFIVTVNYGWYPTASITPIAFHQGVAEGGTPERQIEGSIAFSNDGVLPFFLDPSPTEHAEFGPQIVALTDLGGGAINVLREYGPLDAEIIGSVDLLSTAIHELGHALGLVAWPFFNDEALDGAIDVTIAGYEGTAIPLMTTHLNVVGPAMSGLSRPLGSRRVITDLDVLAISQVSQFNDFLLPPGSDFNGDWKVDAQDLLSWTAAMESWTTADANHDGLTDGADYLIWQQQFGWTVGQASESVPEPTLTAMFGVLLPCGLLLRRSRPRSVARSV